jgi:transcription initiation factor TFIIB
MQRDFEQYVEIKYPYCPECRSKNLINDYDMGETICGDCGLVLSEEMMNKGPDWRASTLEERKKRSHAGAHTSYSKHHKNLSTTMNPTRDRYGNELPSETKAQYWRLRKWQNISTAQSGVDKNLAQAMPELYRLVDNLGNVPPPVVEKAAVIYRKAVNEGLSKGRAIEELLAGSLYVAIRKTKTRRTLNEIAKAYNTIMGRHESMWRSSRKEVSRSFRLLVKEQEIQMPIRDPIECVSKIAEKIGICGENQGYATKILNEAKAKPIPHGKDPMGLAAAALWISCKKNHEKKTQKDIAEAADITEVTLRNRKNELAERLGIEVPD